MIRTGLEAFHIGRTQHSILNTQYLTLNIQHSALSTQHSTLNIQHSKLLLTIIQFNKVNIITHVT